MIGDSRGVGTIVNDDQPAANSADLAVTKTATRTASTIHYTVTVTNLGPGRANQVWMTDILALQTNFQSINAPAGWTCRTPAAGRWGAIVCTAPSQNPNTTATFAITTRLANCDGAPVVNLATAGSSTPDPRLANNVASARTTGCGGDN